LESGGIHVARKAVAQELSRERILEKARELFISCGYRALTMRSIAKAMGYSHGALYYHFTEKADLFYALIKEDFAMLVHKQKEIMVRDQGLGVNLLHKMMMEFIRFGLDNPHHYEIMFMIDEPELLRYSRTEQAQCMELFATVIKQVTGSHAATDARKFMLPWNLFMSLHGFISYSIHYGQTFEDVRKLAEEHIRLICNSLGLIKPELRSTASMIS
jgi:AcrR family transcriptional regulator